MKFSTSFLKDIRGMILSVEKSCESVTSCHRLELPAAHGNRYLANLVTAKTLLRLAQMALNPPEASVVLKEFHRSPLADLGRFLKELGSDFCNIGFGAGSELVANCHQLDEGGQSVTKFNPLELAIACQGAQ